MHANLTSLSLTFYGTIYTFDFFRLLNADFALRVKLRLEKNKEILRHAANTMRNIPQCLHSSNDNNRRRRQQNECRRCALRNGFSLDWSRDGLPPNDNCVITALIARLKEEQRLYLMMCLHL